MQDLEWKYRRRRAWDRWWTPNLEAKAWVVAIPKAFDPYAQPIFFSFVLLKLSADHSTWENIDPTVGLSSLTKTQERRSFQALWQSPHSTCQADLFRYFTPDQYESSLVMETHIIVFHCFSMFFCVSREDRRKSVQVWGQNRISSEHQWAPGVLQKWLCSPQPCKQKASSL